MLFGRSYVSIFSIFLVVVAVLVGGSNLHGQSSSPPAQSSSGSVGLIVPVTGVADFGSFFTGALLIQNFAAQGNSIVSTGTITGALTGNGTFRNIVMQVMLPLDVNASRAGLNTDAALAQSSCDVLHVELGGTSVNVLGSTVGLNPVAFDIASPTQSSGASSPVAQPAPAAPTPVAQPGAGATATAQPGTVTPSTSANATQPRLNQQPPPSPAAPTAPTGAASQTPLASRLCSVNGFRDVSNPAQLAKQLNGVLATLAGK